MVDLKFFSFPFGPLEVNLFVLSHPGSGEALLVDAGVMDDSVTNYLTAQKLTLTTVLITHLHRDHIDALDKYVQLGVERIISPAALDTAPRAEIVSPGDVFMAAQFEFRVFRTSGHTPESISYYCADQEICFVGDALFAGAVGGTSNDKDHEEEVGLIHQHLMGLPLSTRIYSGHGPATTVAIEKAANPFLQPGFTRLP